jgi:hypothetical protein
MEEDEKSSKTLPDWVELEYLVRFCEVFKNLPFMLKTYTGAQHMRTLAGKGAHIHFTHLSKPSADSLEKVMTSKSSGQELADATAHQIGVLDLMKRQNIPLEKVCLLDPKADAELSPADGDGEFEWFLFGVNLLSAKPPIMSSSEIVMWESLGHFRYVIKINPYCIKRVNTAVQAMILRKTARPS